MFKVKVENLLSNNFIDGCRKIAAYPNFKPFKTVYNISRAIHALQAAQNEAGAKLSQLQRDYQVKKDDGGFEIPAEKLDAYSAAQKEIFDQEVIIERYALEPSDVEEVGLSPQEIIALGDMIADVPSASPAAPLALEKSAPG